MWCPEPAIGHKANPRSTAEISSLRFAGQLFVALRPTAGGHFPLTTGRKGISCFIVTPGSGGFVLSA